MLMVKITMELPSVYLLRKRGCESYRREFYGVGSLRGLFRSDLHRTGQFEKVEVLGDVGLKHWDWLDPSNPWANLKDERFRRRFRGQLYVCPLPLPSRLDGVQAQVLTERDSLRYNGVNYHIHRNKMIRDYSTHETNLERCTNLRRVWGNYYEDYGHARGSEEGPVFEDHSNPEQEDNFYWRPDSDEEEESDSRSSTEELPEALLSGASTPDSVEDLPFDEPDLTPPISANVWTPPDQPEQNEFLSPNEEQGSDENCPLQQRRDNAPPRGLLLS